MIRVRTADELLAMHVTIANSTYALNKKLFYVGESVWLFWYPKLARPSSVFAVVRRSAYWLKLIWTNFHSQIKVMPPVRIALLSFKIYPFLISLEDRHRAVISHNKTSDLQKFCLTPPPNHPYTSRHPVPLRGALAIVTNEGRVAVDAAASGACGGRRAGLSSVSEHSAQTTGANVRRKPAGCVRQNRVVLTPVAGVKPAEVRRPNRVRTILQSAGDGGKTNSSPGRARHKP